MEDKRIRVERRSDEEVAEQAARGDTEALGTLYQQYNRYVEKTAYGVVRNHQDAEDVAQTVWTKLLLSIRQYTPEARFTTWLYRVVTHAAIDHLRKRKRAEELPNSGYWSDDPDGSAGVTSQFYPLDQELAYLHERIRVELERAARALTKSNEARGSCFRMYYLREMTVRDISDALRLSEGTIKSHLYYCRRYISENHTVLGELHLALEERLGKHNGNRVY